MLDNKKRAIVSIIIYLLIMIIGVSINNNFFSSMENNSGELVSRSIIQLVSSAYIFYIIKKYYGWKDVGFGKLNFKSLIWFLPYVLILIPMGFKLVQSIYENSGSFSYETWLTIIITLVGTSLAGFSEEVIFRGMILNSFKSDKSIIGAMIISSIGFSIAHITTIFMGKSLIEAIINVIYSSLLGFSFVALAIKLNNIWPVVIFHVIWNFILMASSLIGVEVSKVSLLCNPLNIIMSVILWTIIIRDQRKKNKLKYSLNKVIKW